MKERWLFAGMVLLLLVPLWSVAYLPTTDGPSHVYNAWVLRHLGNVADHPLLHEHYEVDWRPIPNWLSHAALALLMFPFGPRVAEKVLLSGYVILFAAAARYLVASVDVADRDHRWLAWLALPLIYNQLLQMGFYNFVFSLAFYLLALGTWWRHRSSPDLGLALKLNLLLLLCWFSHIVSLVLALASIGILWLITLRSHRSGSWKRHLLHLAILAPQVLLPLWFIRDQAKGPVAASWDAEFLWTYLLRLRVLHSVTREQLWIGTALALLFLVLLAVTLWGRRREGRLFPDLKEQDGFLLLSLLAAVLYFVSPEGMSGGTLLKNRLSLYPYLLLIPWLAPRGNAWRVATVTAVAVLTVLQVGVLTRWYGLVQPEIREVLAAAEPIAPDSRVLPLIFKRNAAAGGPGVLSHVLDYAAAEKGWVDWGNYEALTGHFPVRFRPGAGQMDIFALEAHPDQLNLRAYKGRTDYVFTWKMPPGSRMARQLRQHFKLLTENGPGRVYRRKRASRAPNVRE